MIGKREQAIYSKSQNAVFTRDGSNGRELDSVRVAWFLCESRAVRNSAWVLKQ